MAANKLYFLSIILISFLLFSCESGVESNKAEPTKLDLSKQEFSEIVTSEAKNVTIMAINTPRRVMQGHEKALALEDDGLGKSSGIEVYKWDPSTMWHTWEDDITNSAYPDAFLGHYKRGQQYFDANGNFVKKAKHASGMNFYYMTSGYFGYVDGSPSGTSWNHKVGSEEDPITATLTDGVFTLSGNGQYQKIWDGYYTDAHGQYNNELVRFETLVLVNIDQLSMVDSETATLYGDMTFEMLPWSAALSCDGSDVVSGVLMYNGVVVQNLEYSVSALLAAAQTLLP